MQKLRVANIKLEEIDYIIISHGHWENIGGIANEEVELNFPDAIHVMTMTEWEYWTNEENLKGLSEGFS